MYVFISTSSSLSSCSVATQSYCSCKMYCVLQRRAGDVMSGTRILLKKWPVSLLLRASRYPEYLRRLESVISIERNLHHDWASCSCDDCGTKIMKPWVSNSCRLSYLPGPFQSKCNCSHLTHRGNIVCQSVKIQRKRVIKHPSHQIMTGILLPPRYFEELSVTAFSNWNNIMHRSLATTQLPTHPSC